MSDKVQQYARLVSESLNRRPTGGFLHEFIGWYFTLEKNGTHRKLTASLTPPGRGFTVEDWERLGAVVAAVGMPLDAHQQVPMPQSVVDDPNGDHVWEWEEKP